MTKHQGLLLIAICLLALSAIVFVIQYELFHDTRDMLFYLLQDLAFLPIQILLVAVIVERIITSREKARLLLKMNMVIGSFFSELGIRLLGDLTKSIKNLEGLRPLFAVQMDWTAEAWDRSLKAASGFDYRIDPDDLSLDSVRQLLAANRNLLTLLLANPNLMEHDRFTDLLWAISHLMEELSARESLTDLPASDRAHLAGDARRAYTLLTVEWLLYCRHLQKAYPYIFSLTIRMHPLQANPSAIVR
jgi:hypothetical protein